MAAWDLAGSILRFRLPFQAPALSTAHQPTLALVPSCTRKGCPQLCSAQLPSWSLCPTLGNSRGLCLCHSRLWWLCGEKAVLAQGGTEGLVGTCYPWPPLSFWIPRELPLDAKPSSLFLCLPFSRLTLCILQATANTNPFSNNNHSSGCDLWRASCTLCLR